MPDFRALFLALIVALPGSVLAAAPPQPFSASYTLLKGNSKVGKAVIKLAGTQDSISWQLDTEPSGLYSLLTTLKPFSESVMQINGSDFRLHSIFMSLSRNDEAVESATFDWKAKQGFFKRKGKKKSATLKSAVYDYLSIHWLSAQMTINSGTKTEFDFYRKGKLLRSTLALTNQTQLEINEDTIPVRCYHQKFDQSSRQYEFCYGSENPYMPLKITKIKSGKKPSILLFKKLN